MVNQELIIDKFGRVLIPFEIRSNFGLETGSILVFNIAELLILFTWV